MLRALVAFLVLVGTICVSPSVSHGQICGDADGNGSVSVSDGVQTLRAAAGLETGCTTATCDVDGNGSITVTDGVSVLRKAAGLPITENCTGGSGAQPETVLREIQPLLTIGLAFATGTPVTSCANAPDGEISTTVGDDGTTTSFDFCQVGSIEFLGDIIVSDALLTFSFLDTLTVGDEDDIAEYDGELTMAAAGSGRSVSGPVDVDTFSAGFTVLTFNGTVVEAGRLTGGSATLDLADSDLVDAFTTMTLTFDGSGIAQVQATQANGGTTSVRFDLANGVIVP